MLLVSGGHTMLVEMREHGHYRLLGQTIDDAAGEAFDKVARFLGLGYPGGPAIERIAARRRPDGDRLPAGDAQRGPRLQLLRAEDVGDEPRPQATPTSTRPTSRRRSRRPSSTCSCTRPGGRAAEVGAKGLALGGGVAANSLLRERLLDACADDGLRGFLPSRAMCTDNAAMIAAAGWHRLRRDGPTPLDAGAYPNLRLD